MSISYYSNTVSFHLIEPSQSTKSASGTNLQPGMCL